MADEQPIASNARNSKSRNMIIVALAWTELYGDGLPALRITSLVIVGFSSCLFPFAFVVTTLLFGGKSVPDAVRKRHLAK